MNFVKPAHINTLQRQLQRLRLISVSFLLASMATTASSAELPSATPESQGLSKQRLARVRGVIEAEINASRMPGAVVLVARKGAVVHAESLGWQDKDAGTPMKRDTIFRA
ncbi:MAG: hypothetical protein RL678_1602, partial [Pseudomonadota bacterium]